MRLRLPRALAALCAFSSASAQATRVAPPEFTRQAFDRSFTTSAGIESFGPRLNGASAGDFRYKSSLAVALGGELPLSRRAGLQANLSIAPISGQEEHIGQTESATFASFAVFALDAGIAARVKPRAPVFLYLGGGADYAPRHAGPIDGGGSATEPYGTIAIGYDQEHRDRWNFRVLVGDRIVRPHDPRSTLYVVRPSANDVCVLFGARYSYRRAAARDSAHFE